jgi:hypothetical protein
MQKVFARVFLFVRLIRLGVGVVLLSPRRQQTVCAGIRRRCGCGDSRGFRPESQFLQRWSIELAAGIQSVRRLEFSHGIGSGVIPLPRRRSGVRAVLSQGSLDFVDAVRRRSSLPFHFLSPGILSAGTLPGSLMAGSRASGFTRCGVRFRRTRACGGRGTVSAAAFRRFLVRGGNLRSRGTDGANARGKHREQRSDDSCSVERRAHSLAVDCPYLSVTFRLPEQRRKGIRS